MQYIANTNHNTMGKDPMGYAAAEQVVMDSLGRMVAEFVECCDPVNRGASGCGGCKLTASEIREILISNGYRGVPAKFQTTVTRAIGDTIKNRATFVEDNANLWVSLLPDNTFIDFSGALAVEISRGANEGHNVKGFFTKNENFCGTNLRSRVESSFDSDNVDAFIHFHCWESQDSLVPDTVFGKIEYILVGTLDEVEIVAEVGPCGPRPLPNGWVIEDYAITADSGTYYGYTFEEAPIDDWVRGDSVQLFQEIDYSTPFRTTDKEHTWGDGGLEFDSETFPYFFPSMAAWLHASSETSELDERFRTFLVKPGLRIRQEREDTYLQYFRPQITPNRRNIGTSQHWSCDSHVSQLIYRHPGMQVVLDGIEGKMTEWLTTHDNFDGFINANDSWFKDTLLNPYLSHPQFVSLWALFGGTQGKGLQIRSMILMPFNCPTHGANTRKHFTCDLYFTVLDNFAAGITDARRWWYPGLVEMWLLQHTRNASCSPPCYIPITRHSAQVHHSFIICLD